MKSKPKKRRSGANDSLYLEDSATTEESIFASDSHNQRYHTFRQFNRKLPILISSFSFQINDSQLDISEKINASPKNSAKKKKNKSKDDDDEPSSEEERWLHAIEAGKLEEVRLTIA